MRVLNNYYLKTDLPIHLDEFVDTQVSLVLSKSIL